MTGPNPLSGASPTVSTLVSNPTNVLPQLQLSLGNFGKGLPINLLLNLTGFDREGQDFRTHHFNRGGGQFDSGALSRFGGFPGASTLGSMAGSTPLSSMLIPGQSNTPGSLLGDIMSALRSMASPGAAHSSPGNAFGNMGATGNAYGASGHSFGGSLSSLPNASASAFAQGAPAPSSLGQLASSAYNAAPHAAPTPQQAGAPQLASASSTHLATPTPANTASAAQQSASAQTAAQPQSLSQTASAAQAQQAANTTPMAHAQVADRAQVMQQQAPLAQQAQQSQAMTQANTAAQTAAAQQAAPMLAAAPLAAPIAAPMIAGHPQVAPPVGNPLAQGMPAADASGAGRAEVTGTGVYTGEGPGLRRRQGLRAGAREMGQWVAAMANGRTTLSRPQDDMPLEIARAFQWMFWTLTITAYVCLALVLVGLLLDFSETLPPMSVLGDWNSGFGLGVIGLTGLATAISAWWLGRGLAHLRSRRNAIRTQPQLQPKKR